MHLVNPNDRAREAMRARIVANVQAAPRILIYRHCVAIQEASFTAEDETLFANIEAQFPELDPPEVID